MSLLFWSTTTGQSIVVNEISQGVAASEYVELAVVGTPGCSTIPCMDLRGLILDDNNGNFATGSGTGIAQGAARFSNDSFWSCIPIGTIILIYNDNDPNSSLLADDIDMNDGNCSLTIPFSSTLFEHHPSIPNTSDAQYPTTGWLPGGTWSSVSMSNSDDSFQILNPNNPTSPLFAVSWGNNANTANSIISYTGSAGSTVFNFSGNVSGDYFDQNNWTSEDVSTGETPGLGNSIENEGYLNQMNNNCSPIVPMSLSSTQTDVTCNGGCNGSGSVNIDAGGFAPFNYDWAGAGDTPTAASNTGLCAGTHTVTVTDANGCTETIDVVITEPAAIIATETNVDISCFGLCDGSVDATTSGGTGALTYSWDSGETTEDITGLCAGDYTLTVTDANGCTETVTATITEPADITVNVSGTGTSCGNCDGTAAVTYSGGTGALTVDWPTVPSTADNVTNLCAGSYDVTITDANGCTATETQSISDAGGPTITVDGSTNVSCFGVCDGTIDVTVAGGSAPLTYSWDNGETTDDLTGLCAGDYCLTVTDNNGCTAVQCVTITEPTDITASETHTDVTCFGVCDGTIDATTAGGTGTLVYAWDSGQTTEDLTGLCAGTYTLTITDDNGCTTIVSTTLIEPNDIVPQTNSNAASCGQDDGGVSVTVIGGTVAADYTYEWQDDQGNVVGTTATVNNLFPGNYCVTVTDDNGCTATACIDVDNITAGTIAVNVDGNVSCNGVCDGAATITTTGGTAPYTYNWMDSNGNVVFTENTANLTSTINTLCADDYDVQVIDAVGCIMTDNFTITEPAPLAIVLDNSTNVTCFGACDGTADLTTSGGTAPYTYAWDSGQTTEDLTGLCAGDYNLTVTDDNGCIVNITVTITEPTELTLATAAFEVTCFGGSDGQVIVIPSGGTVSNTYDFEWTNSSGTVVSTDPDANGLPAGTYTINVWDDNSCNATADVIVIEPTPITYSFTSTPSNCGQADGEACVTAAGGTEAGTYDFEWTNSSGTVVSSADCATGVLAGDYTVSITDDNGCVITADTTIADLAGPTLAIDNITIPTCFGDCDGEISLVTSGGQSTNFVYGYSFNGGAPQVTPNPATGLCQGDYVFTAVDEFGCIATVATNMTEPTEVVVRAYSDTTICIGGCADLSALAIGGTGAYTYDWGTYGTNMAFTDCPTTNTTYSVIAYDANGCASAPASVDVTINPPLTLNLATIGPDTVCPNTIIDVTALANGGNGQNLTITWTPTPMQVSNNMASFDFQDSLVVYASVDDACGSPTVSDSVQLFQYQYPDLEITPSYSEGCAPLTVQFNHNLSPGYDYDWYSNDGTYTSSDSNPYFVFNDEGSYELNVTVTTTENCSLNNSSPAEITVFDVPDAIISSEDNIEYNTLENQVELDGSKSTNTVSYNWILENEIVSTNYIFNETIETEGIHEVTLVVISNEGCVDSVSTWIEIKPYFQLFVPNAFSPNGDGKNETFFPVGLNINYHEFEFQIFNRWGELIYTTDSNEPWDGTTQLNGQNEVQEDVYIWYIKTVDIDGNRLVKMGHVNLIK